MMLLCLMWTALCLESPITGQVTRIQVPGPALAGNAINEPSTRFVSVYLPPSYATEAEKRFPVLYLLHGIGDNDQRWTGQRANIAAILDREIAARRIREFIVVMPDQRTQFFGSFYANSKVTGDWESYTTKDLVAYIDKHYRTLAKAGSRGVAGHSMGGHGALRLAMKFPGVFSMAYGLNPAVLGWGADLTIDNDAFEKIASFKGIADLIQDARESGNIYAAGIVCLGQAFSGNPDKPPFFMNSPFIPENGKMVVHEATKTLWEQNMPIYMAKHYRDNLMKLKGYRFDSGFEDEFTHIPVTAEAFSNVLNELGVPHIFEAYNGDHRNKLPGIHGRLATEVLPWFSRLLAYE